MADDDAAPESFALSPLGSPQDDVREIAETKADRIRPFRFDAYGEIIEYQPKTAEEADLLRRGRGDLLNRHLSTIVGLGVITLVVLTSIATFLGLTLSSAPSAHEDAVRLLILIVGAVLGTLYGAEIGKDRS